MYLLAIGEIFLKGKNRITFERRLMKNIRSYLSLGNNDLIKLRNRYLIPKDIDETKLNRIFGMSFYVKVLEAPLAEVQQAAFSLVREEKTFRITAKKSLTFGKTSTEINEDIGDYILTKKPELKVNLDHPELDIRIEELRNKVYLYKASDMKKGLGGLPVGSSGFVHLKVKDHLPSTVAGFLLMKRGCVLSLSKELPLLAKFEQGFNLKIGNERSEDILATDETFETLKNEEETKFILRPLVGYTQEQIKELYSFIGKL